MNHVENFPNNRNIANICNVNDKHKLTFKNSRNLLWPLSSNGGTGQFESVIQNDFEVF